ncbi:MAG: hypothetical protein V2J16_03290 [Thermoleophilia bacterium]|nr:hypothetical protein [Thermoleophilia bacterium]
MRGLCLRLGELGRRHRLLVVPGGGAFADAVRDCDARFGLGADAAHWMAILAMDQYGLLLGELIPAARPIRSFDAVAGPAAAGAVTVLLPHDLLREADALPHSWAVTSDAIAAWVATVARAPLLVLLKHGAALGALAAATAAAGERPLERLGEAGIVDEAFARVVEAGRASGGGFDVWLLDGGRPERLEALLETGRAEGVRVER